MAHAIDLFGWYAGEVADGSPRSTAVAPSNTSTSTTVGQGRSNWTGHEWVEVPYFEQSVAYAQPVPHEVTMRQARLALFAAGKLSSVDAAIDAMPEPNKTLARIEWEYSNAVQRNNAFVAALGPALGMTDEQVDALFIAASAL
jgi:hypothetical protein